MKAPRAINVYLVQHPDGRWQTVIKDVYGDIFASPRSLKQSTARKAAFAYIRTICRLKPRFIKVTP